MKQMRITAAEYREWATKPKARSKTRPKLEAPRHRAVVDEIVVELPIPPTANHCWVNVAGAGRVRSPEYRRWHKSAAQEAALVRGRIDGRYTALIALGRIAGADVDNRTKPTLDMLAGLLTDDDGLCERATAEWADDIEPRRMRVTLRRAA